MRIGIDYAVPRNYEEYYRKFKKEGFSERIAGEKAAMACIDRGFEIPTPAPDKEEPKVKQTRKRFYDE